MSRQTRSAPLENRLLTDAETGMQESIHQVYCSIWVIDGT